MPKQSLKITLKYKLKRHRERYQLSQQDVAIMLGCPRSYVSLVEHGHAFPTRPDKMEAMGALLGIRSHEWLDAHKAC